MPKLENLKFVKGLKKLFTNKLFLFSLSLYILIPIAYLLIVNADNNYRTAGTYVYYENGQAVEKVVLNKDNSILIESYNDIVSKDSELVYMDRIVSWSYRVSSWNKTLDPELFTITSREYILFEGESKNTYVAFFKVGKDLYSSYLLPDERGGGQKCYIKV